MRSDKNHFNRMTDDNAFARIIKTMIDEWNTTSDQFTKTQIKWSLQHVLNHWSDKPYTKISQNIAEHFISNYPKVNPFRIRWSTCKKYGVVGTNNQRFIVFEHTTPISELMNQLFKTNEYNEVLKLLQDYSGICLITRDEDNMLYSKGYGSDRVNGWFSAYSDCGIVVMNEDDYNTYKSKL